jgi:predicted RNA-binding protein YlqC (UPF0109 family)
MKGLVEVVARALVDDPNPVEVYEVDEPASADPRGAVYRLKVGKDDLGKVIGKKGRTAKAFRTLLAAAAVKQNRKVTLEILEPERPRRAPSTEGAPVSEVSERGQGSSPDPETSSSSEPEAES